MPRQASAADELRKFAALHADGFLSDEEFAAQKEAVLSASQNDDLATEDLVADELEKLAGLVRADVLTREEFEAQKAPLLWDYEDDEEEDLSERQGVFRRWFVKPESGSRAARSQPAPVPVGWEWVLIVAGVLALIGSFLPWEQVSAGITSFTRNGYQLGNDLSFSPDGLIVTGLGAIAALIGLTRLTRSQFPLWLNGSPTILGAVILVLGINDEGSLSSTVAGLSHQYPSDLFSVGYGLWIVIVCGAVIALAGVTGLWQARSSRRSARARSQETTLAGEAAVKGT